jgi:TPR repeat protein
MFENGVGVAQGFAEAARLYRLAAAQGGATAQNNLGYMYRVYQHGIGVARDDAKGLRLYCLAATQGDEKRR